MLSWSGLPIKTFCQSLFLKWVTPDSVINELHLSSLHIIFVVALLIQHWEIKYTNSSFFFSHVTFPQLNGA